MMTPVSGESKLAAEASVTFSAFRFSGYAGSFGTSA
jgi:hypothetical protein